MARRCDFFSQWCWETAGASARLTNQIARLQLQSEDDLGNIGSVKDLCSLRQWARMHIWCRPQYVNIVSFVCRVHFGAILFKVDDVVVSDHSLSCLVNWAFLYDYLLEELHRLIKDSNVTFSDQIILLVAVKIASSGEVYFILTHFNHINN